MCVIIGGISLSKVIAEFVILEVLHCMQCKGSLGRFNNPNLFITANVHAGL